MNLREELYRDISIDLFGIDKPDLTQPYTSEILRQAYKIDPVRCRICQKRFQKAKKENQFRAYRPEHNQKHMDEVITGNANSLLDDLSGARSSRLIRPLSICEAIRPLQINHRDKGALYDLDHELDIKLLSIGPRTEAEPILLWSYGFKLESITSVDLISYSRMVDLGDMHSLEYEDNSFDVIFSACTLVYSPNPYQAIKEMKRVAKPEALFAFMFDVGSRSIEPELIRKGFKGIQPEAIASMFFNNDDYEILYQHFHKKNLDLINGSTSSVIFRRRDKTIYF